MLLSVEKILHEPMEAFLVDYIKAGQDSGANRFRFCRVSCLL